MLFSGFFLSYFLLDCPKISHLVEWRRGSKVAVAVAVAMAILFAQPHIKLSVNQPSNERDRRGENMRARERERELVRERGWIHNCWIAKTLKIHITDGTEWLYLRWNINHFRCLHFAEPTFWHCEYHHINCSRDAPRNYRKRFCRAVLPPTPHHSVVCSIPFHPISIYLLFSFLALVSVRVCFISIC